MQAGSHGPVTERTPNLVGRSSVNAAAKAVTATQTSTATAVPQQVSTLQLALPCSEVTVALHKIFTYDMRISALMGEHYRLLHDPCTDKIQALRTW